MCIIMTKPKGAPLPSKETFRTCFQNNPDGAGFMYVEDGHVVIDKGYMGYKNMYKRIKKLLAENGDRNVVVHFRIGTSGNNDQRTTHPYPITSDTTLLQKLKLKTDVGIVHNGIINGYEDKLRPDLNDTQVFIRDVLSIFKDMNKHFYTKPRVEDMLEDMTGSKLCILDENDELTYVGHFINVGGVMYSNTTYNTTYKYYRYDDSVSLTEQLIDNEIDSIYQDDYKDYGRVNIELDEDEVYYLAVGDVIETKGGTMINVLYSYTYVVDKYKNVYTLDNDGRIDELLYSDVRIYDANDEEVDII